MYRIFLCLIPILVPLASPLAADQLRREIAQCAIVEGLLKRAECYDAVARAHGLNGPQPAIAPVDGDTGDWKVSDDTNPIDDSRRVVVSLRAESGRGRFGEAIFLVARCQSNKTEVFIQWRDYLGDDSSSVYEEWKYVTERVGDRPSVTRKWGISTNNESTFAPNSPIALLKRMVQANRFIAQVTPYNESPVTGIFNTAGLRNALVPLMQACNWSL